MHRTLQARGNRAKRLDMNRSEHGGAADQLMVGERMGDFEILALAGMGGMGIVYRARQLSLARRVALKVIRHDASTRDDYHERFMREARMAASVNHPNVVQIHDAGEVSGRLYVVMQWIDGEDLKRVLERRRHLPSRRAVQIGCQLAGALDAVHSAGLVHRDIKPANVLCRLMDGVDHVYLTDFGIAKTRTATEEEITGPGQLVGTTGYIAPEQIRGEEPTASSDLYALACVAFRALTGRAPFKADNEAGLRWAHANAPRPKASVAAPELGDRYDAFFARALYEFADALRGAHDADPSTDDFEVKLKRGRPPKPRQTLPTVPSAPESSRIAPAPVVFRSFDQNQESTRTRPRSEFSMPALTPGRRATRRRPGWMRSAVAALLVAVAAFAADQLLTPSRHPITPTALTLAPAVSPTGAFQIRYPVGWHRVLDTRQDTAWAATGARQWRTHPFTSVSETPAGQTNAESTAAAQRAAIRRRPEYQEIGWQRVNIAAGPGWEWRYRLGTTELEKTYVENRCGRVYATTGSAPTALFQRYRPTFDAVLRTLRLTCENSRFKR
jgi:serine/threonine protein kinase